MKKRRPEHTVTVIERNKPYDTFGWGVVFSDAMMQAMRVADPESAAEIAEAFNHWDDIELVFKGSRQRTTGHGFIGIGRKQLLNILQRRCEALGVELVFEREVDSDLEFPDADLIIASDGVNSRIRERYADVFRPEILVRPNRYIWLGTNKLFDAFTFDFRKTEHGWFQAHIYKFDSDASTFIVETTEETFEAHGLGKLDQESSIAFCEKLFAETLDGRETDDQRAASARLGLAELQPADLRLLEPLQRPLARRADGRRRPYRPFRHRLGHQARA